jgi:DNA-binding MarR family transcriptional regulator
MFPRHAEALCGTSRRIFRTGLFLVTAAATGLVDRMVKFGYVERVHAVEDRRKIMVRVTLKGVELVSHMRKVIATDLAGILASMDEDVAQSVECTKRATGPRLVA